MSCLRENATVTREILMQVFTFVPFTYGISCQRSRNNTPFGERIIHRVLLVQSLLIELQSHTSEIKREVKCLKKHRI